MVRHVRPHIVYALFRYTPAVVETQRRNQLKVGNKNPIAMMPVDVQGGCHCTGRGHHELVPSQEKARLTKEYVATRVRVEFILPKPPCLLEADDLRRQLEQDEATIVSMNAHAKRE
jgi:hypothetical protein